MKNILLFTLVLVVFGSCNKTDKKTLEEATDKMCACLEDYDENKSETMLKIITCVNAIGDEEKYKDFSKEDFVKSMEKKCTEAALLFEELHNK